MLYAGIHQRGHHSSQAPPQLLFVWCHKSKIEYLQHFRKKSSKNDVYTSLIRSVSGIDATQKRAVKDHCKLNIAQAWRSMIQFVNLIRESVKFTILLNHGIVSGLLIISTLNQKAHCNAFSSKSIFRDSGWEKIKSRCQNMQVRHTQRN